MSTSKLHKTEQLLILNFNNALRLSSVLGPRMIVHRSYQRTKPHPPPPPIPLDVIQFTLSVTYTTGIISRSVHYTCHIVYNY